MIRQPTEHGAKPHHAEQLSQLDAVDRNIGCGTIARENECGGIRAIDGNRKLPERGERALAR